MALIDIKVPSPGESITEVTISRWLKKNGEYIFKDEEVLEIDSDKATLTVSAEQSGALKISAKDGDVVKVGASVGKIDTDAKAPMQSEVRSPKSEVKAEKQKVTASVGSPPSSDVVATPLAKKIIEENKISQKISGSGENGKITKADVLAAMSKGFSLTPNPSPQGEGSREENRQAMTPLRKKLAQRLVAVKNQTAMLTTFNEVDMSKILELRTKYNPQIEKQFGTKLGFMSFFAKAVCEALQLFPAVNAMIDSAGGGTGSEEIVYHKFCDVGIAVSAPKGLVVPIIRNAEVMSLTGIEQKIKELATKARDNKLSLEEMTGGTFTITNGGVFGSLMSTPIINPPQVAILGMHNVVERPVAINGQVVIRPMMYVALSYDHRIIDGKESVGFLVKVKEMCENPSRMLFGGKHPEEVLLGL